MEPDKQSRIAWASSRVMLVSLMGVMAILLMGVIAMVVAGPDSAVLVTRRDRSQVSKSSRQ